MMIKLILSICVICTLITNSNAQSPTPFSCSGSDEFGYYSSSASSALSGNFLTYSSSRISKIITSTGNRETLCDAIDIGTALNGLAFNPHDNFLYAVSRYDFTHFSGKLFRIGENCQKVEIPVTGPIVKFSDNNVVKIDQAGGNISSAAFDLDNHYYVNTSFAIASSTGFTNKLQKIEITNNTARVISTVTLTCPTCITNKLRITDIAYDEESGFLIGSNKETNTLYRIDATSGVLFEIGTTSITAPILGIYKNRDGNVRAISEDGNIYSVNTTTGVFTFLIESATLNSGNADAASGCYAPPMISGQIFNDANGLSDDTVNGIAINKVGDATLYANLIQDGLVIKTDELSENGKFQFLGLFSEVYEVQISTIKGIKGQSPPNQNLPTGYVWTGDNIGVSAGNDASPNGRQIVVISTGQDREDVNFGFDGIPVTSGYTATAQNNPYGNVQVAVPALTFSDPEEPNISNVTIQMIPNPITAGIVYYDGAAVTAGQLISDYDARLLTVDPIDGSVTVSFTFLTTDMAGITSNVSTVNIPFEATILPVELVNFTGRNIGNENILEWSTALEINSNYFAIEKRTEYGFFEEIGRVLSKGNSTDLVRYSFKDKNILPTSYYRLVQVDTDGQQKVYKTISITSKVAIGINIYPTLVTDYVSVELSGDSQAKYLYQIMNGTGQIVGSGYLDNSMMQLDLSHLSNGDYYFKVLVPNHAPKFIRFVKL